MDKLCCSNSFKERRSIYCYKNSLFTCSVRASRPVSRSSLVLSRKAAAKVKPFFVTTNFFRNFFFKNLSAFKKNRTSRTPANQRRFPFLAVQRYALFYQHSKLFRRNFQNIFCISNNRVIIQHVTKSLSKAAYTIYIGVLVIRTQHPSATSALRPVGPPQIIPKNAPHSQKKKSPHGPSRVPCGVRFGCAVSISRRSVRRLFASRSHSTTP